jgi:aspartokinase
VLSACKGVTDALLAIAEAARAGDIAAVDEQVTRLHKRHAAVATGIIGNARVRTRLLRELDVRAARSSSDAFEALHEWHHDQREKKRQEVQRECHNQSDRHLLHSLTTELVVLSSQTLGLARQSTRYTSTFDMRLT